MKFSVLMSLYAKERPDFLRLSLDSVFNQSLVPDEVILVEDGPLTPELYQVLEEYGNTHTQLKRVPLPVNGGLGKALNEGLRYCSNDLVARMDTDDIAKPDRFKKQVEFMTEHPGITVCSSSIDEFQDSVDNIISEKNLPESHEELYAYGKKRCPINHPAVIYRKEAVTKVGGYGPFPEDYYLWGRLMVAGYKFHNLQEKLLWFRTTPDVFKRRGGWNYCKAINKLQFSLYKIGYISLPLYLKNITIRTVISLLPNSLRSKFYELILRSKTK